VFPVVRDAIYATQRLSKHIHPATNPDTIEELFYVWSVLRCYEQGTRLELSQFCTAVCEERTWAGGRGIAIGAACTRKRLVTS
jgi:hypothetical protein